MGDWHSDKKQNPLERSQNDHLDFTSRRSPVLCRHACVATSQPLATSIGLDFLRKGANAADVAVAVAAVLAVVEPCSTGLGGDMFALYYEASNHKVHALNGSGQAPQYLTLERVLKDCPRGEDDFKYSPHAVTVPGAARGWEDLLLRHGSGQFTMAQLVEPAAVLAEEGFPVTQITSHHWAAGKDQLAQWVESDGAIPLTTNGKDTPKPGEIFHNPEYARTLRDLGANGATKGFYNGQVGRSIVDAIQKHGGVMTLEDLKSHQTLFPKAISQSYRDVHLWQVPPNGQGIAALIGLAGLKYLEDNGLCPPFTPETVGKTATALHTQVEMMRLGFADARRFVTCPEHTVSTDWLMDPTRIGERAHRRFDLTKAQCQADDALVSSDTISFQVVDAQGNAISFVNSNFMGFGTGLVPDGCGFTLQNRGFNFSLDADHANCLVGGKRPYHTIIPAMLTRVDEADGKDKLYATLSNMGGFMQPQGHLQLTINMVAGEMDPQSAIDAPRFCIPNGMQDGSVYLESGFSDEIIEEIVAMGHMAEPRITGHARSIFGRAQIIKKDPNTGVLWAGSDGRADGCALGF